jgi:hypothetical protein
MYRYVVLTVAMNEVDSAGTQSCRMVLRPGRQGQLLASRLRGYKVPRAECALRAFHGTRLANTCGREALFRCLDKITSSRTTGYNALDYAGSIGAESSGDKTRFGHRHVPLN